MTRSPAAPPDGPRTGGLNTETSAAEASPPRRPTPTSPPSAPPRSRHWAAPRPSRSSLAALERQRAKPYVGPRPRIVTRRGWGANEGLRERKFVYTKKVKAAFVHHTASGNNYRCSQSPSLIRSIYRYHVKSMGWRDVGYNFLVDKCGNIYEGRAGGVAKPVLGAHTLGFNTNSMGIAVLGSYGAKKPSVRRRQGHRPAHRVEAGPVPDESAREDIPEVGW